MRRNEEDAPISAVRVSGSEPPNSTQGSHSPALLDHLIGAGEDRWRHGEAEFFGGLEIDDQIECRRLLDRQISRLGAFQNSPGVTAGLAKGVREPHTIADQPAGRRELSPDIDRWNGMA